MSVVRMGGAAGLFALCLAAAGCSGGSRPYPNHQLEGRVVDGRTLLIPRSQVGRKGAPLAILLVGPEEPRIDPERVSAYWLKEPDLIFVNWWWHNQGPFVDGNVLVRVPDAEAHPIVELYRDHLLSYIDDVASATGVKIYRFMHRRIAWDDEMQGLRFETQEHVTEMFDRPQEHAYKLEPRGASDDRGTYFFRDHILYEIRRYRLTPGGLEYLGGVKCGETPGWTPAEVAKYFGVSEEAFKEANRAFPPKGQWALPGNLEPLHPRTLQEVMHAGKK